MSEYNDLKNLVVPNAEKEFTARALLLTDNFEAIYDVDMVTGDYKAVLKSQSYSDRITSQFVEKREFFSDVFENIKIVIHPNDVEMMQKVLTREYIAEALSKKTHFDTYYRLYVDNKQEWLRMRVVYRDESKDHLIIGVFNAEDEMQAKENERQFTESLLMIEGLASEFAALYCADLDTGGFRVPAAVNQRSWVHHNLPPVPKNAPAVAMYRGFATNFVHPDHLERILAIYPSDEVLRKSLEGKKKVSAYFLCRHPDRYYWTRLEFIKCEPIDQPACKVILGFTECDAEYRRREEAARKERERAEASERLRVVEQANKLLDFANRHEKLRAEALDFMFNNQNVFDFIPFLAEKVFELYGCDRVVYRDVDGQELVNERPGVKSLDMNLCRTCPYYPLESPVYAEGDTIVGDRSVGYKGVVMRKNCRVKASLTQVIHRRGKVFGYISLHYIENHHNFDPLEVDTFDRIAKFFSLALERSESDRQLKEALHLAEAANRAKTLFLNNMSHDIRTPMNAIIGFTNIAMKNLGDSKRVEDSLSKTRKASELLLSLINSVLDMSRVESGKAKLEEVEADIYQSFAGVELTMDALAKAKGISLSFGFGEIRDRYVYADCDRATRVFVNLISNAIKYSKPNGYVKVRCEELASNRKTGSSERFALYRYTFEDNGIGMSEEFQRHAFEEFSREYNSTTCGIQGTGLGLALCKTFVELMNGKIMCKSVQGEGTTFTIEVPFRIRECEEQPIPAGPADAAGDDEIKGVDESPRFASKRILLVEDNMFNREVADYVLKEQGFVVETAEDGSIAVNMVREKGNDYYDFILMDIQMPVMGGYEATKILRSEGLKRPIIALSANAFAEDRAASLAAGMDAHVAKPIKVNELLAALAKLV